MHCCLGHEQQMQEPCRARVDEIPLPELRLYRSEDETSRFLLARSRKTMPNPFRKLKFGKLAKGKDNVAPAATPANASLGRPGAEGATEAGPSHHPAHGFATNTELPPAYDGISTPDDQALEESFWEAAPVLAEDSGPQSQQPGIATLTLEAEEDSSSPSESFGLFEFTPRVGARPAIIPTTSLSAAQAQQQIGIIAVHGLGGTGQKPGRHPTARYGFEIGFQRSLPSRASHAVSGPSAITPPSLLPKARPTSPAPQRISSTESVS